jgi:ketosteroid isomerase-like protein
MVHGACAVERKRALAAFAVLVAVLCLLAGCGGKNNKAEPVKPSGFASADAKNIHEFIVRFPDTAASGDAGAMLRLFTEDARYVPLLGKDVRPIRGGGELERQLPASLAEQRRMGLAMQWREPMNILVKGERASVRAVADLRWNEGGKPRDAVMSCYFGLVRDDNYLWRIREFHGEPVGPGFKVQQPAQPAKAPAKKPVRKEKIVIQGEPPKPAVKQPPTTPAPQPAPPPAQEKPPYDGPLVEDSPKPFF